ncbi:hypothetical protein GCM10009122_58850 [Fulvivirga kasyanovii]|uniref:Uncharacterized protein n=1 Tax=Fulvivirga kasyanovii TaxID=396812 RepID=A0ABW9RXI1_9BACT|nr:hypothetical protein [Fulvivirga kasyanovii]MTI27979.1 hypothetical protein [Fulvivirga kasyanovii]
MKHLKLINIKNQAQFEQFVGQCAIEAFFLRKAELDEDLVFFSRQIIGANSAALESFNNAYPDLTELIQQVNTFFLELSKKTFEEK